MTVVAEFALKLVLGTFLKFLQNFILRLRFFNIKLTLWRTSQSQDF